MKTSKDFSEIQEAADLLTGILLRARPEPPKPESPKPGPEKKSGPPAAGVKPPVPEEIKSGDSGFRGDRIEKALEIMCRRGEFIGAVIADINGLPLAVYNSPVGTDALAAFTSVLGNALEKAGHLLNQHGADNISMDINYTDKVVLRHFIVAGQDYYLMIVCPQSVDERSEIELSIEQIISIMR